MSFGSSLNLVGKSCLWAYDSTNLPQAVTGIVNVTIFCGGRVWVGVCVIWACSC